MATTVIAASTRYDATPESRLRFAEAVSLARRATERHIPLVYADADSCAEDIAALIDAGATVVPATRAEFGPPYMYGRCQRDAINAALQLNPDAILFTQPEKPSIVDSIDAIIEPLQSGMVDIVIPYRLSTASYPCLQQHFEKFINSYWHTLTGRQLDVCFGVRAFTPRGAAYFTDYASRSYAKRFGPYRPDSWEAIFLPLIDALAEGVPVKGITVDYEHPGAMTRYEERNEAAAYKRHQQSIVLFEMLRDQWHKRKAMPPSH